MFTFFECYRPDYYGGLIKSGLLRKNTGLKIQMYSDVKEEYKFNNIAKKDGELYNILKENGFPVYVDRLQGGSLLQNYKYDQKVLGDLTDLCGDKFYGFQLHEFTTNYRGDLNRISEGIKGEWNAENIVKALRTTHPGDKLALEALYPEEHEKYGCPATVEEFIKTVLELIKLRVSQYGKIIVVDSFALSHKAEYECGANLIMPEIGDQTENSVLQMCYAKSSAKTHKKAWGVYSEPWGGEPFSTSLYNRDGENEWTSGTAIEGSYISLGQTGGSSRSLQKRVYHYAYLSGAHFLSEEWSLANTFYDFRDFELSPFGIVKKEFKDFTEKYSDIGEKLTPVAVVLPKDVPLIAHTNLWYTFEGVPFSSSQYEKKYNGVRERLFNTVCKNLPMVSRENKFANRVLPDAVAVIHEDSADIGDYKYLVDMTYNPDFASKHDNIIADEQILPILNEELPVNAEGECHYMVNALSDGSYYLALWNHDGIFRNAEKGEYVMPEGSKKIAIDTKGLSLSALEGEKNITKENGKYYLTLSSGDWLFAHIG